MIRLSTSALSTLGKKILMGLSGLFLSGFIVVHLIGNIALFYPDKDPFNKYAHFLMSLGGLLYLAELILAALFLGHFIYAIMVTWQNWSSGKPGRYAVVTNQGHPSRKTWASTTMIYTGIIIMVFLVLHLLHFKYGPVIMYTTKDGMYIRDLYTLVHQFYGNIWNALFYMVVMVLLGFHLSHGFWSAFQSLGISHPVYTPLLYGLGYLFAIIMGFGFFVIPVWSYFTGGAL
jgi:succinate dehydrogenase / fumarate reductase cytochrome b subunit